MIISGGLRNFRRGEMRNFRGEGLGNFRGGGGGGVDGLKNFRGWVEKFLGV